MLGTAIWYHVVCHHIICAIIWYDSDLKSYHIKSYAIISYDAGSLTGLKVTFIYNIIYQFSLYEIKLAFGLLWHNIYSYDMPVPHIRESHEIRYVLCSRNGLGQGTLEDPSSAVKFWDTTTIIAPLPCKVDPFSLHLRHHHYIALETL
jgi:hypothetical protein